MPKDIDECLAGTSMCEQICHNSPGSFTCDCFMGFTLSADRHACDKSGIILKLCLYHNTIFIILLNWEIHEW